MQYLKYSQYHKEPGGKKKLSFIIHGVQDIKKKNLSILDVGCGNGNVSFPLGFLGYNVMAIDIASDLIKKNSQKNQFKNLKFQMLDLNDPNISINKKFDVVLLLDILEHINNPEELLNNLKKVCKKDSILIISIPNGFGFSELVSRSVRRVEKITKLNFVDKFKKKTGKFSVQSDNYTPHLHFFTFQKIISLIEKYGFKLAKHRNSTVFSSSLRWSGKLERFDIELADNLSPKLASGWYLIFQNQN